MANSANVATPTAHAPMPTHASPNLAAGATGLFGYVAAPVDPWISEDTTPTMPWWLGVVPVTVAVVAEVTVPVTPATETVTPAGPVGTGWPTFTAARVEATTVR